MTSPRPRLGRGLESLIPLSAEGEGAGVRMVALTEIKPSSEQARRKFDAAALQELADSIRSHGLLQPILVRKADIGYELIAGERRWRAAQLVGLEEIPALVRERREDSEALILGLVENLQRTDLDPIEEATGIRRLIDQYGLTHEEAASRLGKHRVSVSQAMRLLNGCPALQSAISAGVISAGHGRALVGLESVEAQELGLKVVVARRLSVRETEAWVQSYQTPRPRRQVASREPDQELLSVLAEELGQEIEVPVTIKGSSARGRLSIDYASAEELDRIAERLRGR